MFKNIDYSTIGKRIRSLRKQKGWTQAQLAKQCECSVSFQGHIERGTRVPSLETIVKIASLLDVSIDQLIYGLDTTSSSASAAMRKMYVLLDEITRVLRKYVDDCRLLF